MKQHFDLEYSIRTSLYLHTPTFPVKPRLSEGNTQEELLLLPGHTEMNSLSHVQRLMRFQFKMDTFRLLPAILAEAQTRWRQKLGANASKRLLSHQRLSLLG